MSLNLIAILVSLAMMLTGAGVEGQPAEASRVATLRNVVLTYNGETLHLSPEAHAGVWTDGSRARFDFGVDLDGDTLLPIQVGVDEGGVTALFAESGEAVTVTAQALEGLAEQIAGPLNSLNDEDPELVSFITEEYLPAYGSVLKAATDADVRNEIQAACMAVYDKKVDRGEGTPDTVEVEGDSYDVTAYSYTLDGAQLGELTDAMYASVPALSDYYDAVFKLYAMLPEESGLTDIDSFAALVERTGLDMTLDVEERRSDDGDIDVMDAVLTLDMSAAMGGIEPEGDAEDEIEDDADAPEGDEADETEDDADAPEDGGAEPLEPVVVNVHTTRVGDFINSEASCDYDDDGTGFRLTATSAQESAALDSDMTLYVLENGVKTQGCRLSMFAAHDEEGGDSYSASLRYIVQDDARVELSLYGMRSADGTSENSVTAAVRNRSTNAGVSFDLDVTADDIPDAVTGREASWVIDDLSGEALQAQLSDAGVAALLMKVTGSLGMDANKLEADKGVSKLVTLIDGGELPIDVDDLEDDAYDLTYEMGEDEDDYAYVVEDGEEGDLDLELDDEPAVDDGVLDFPQPSLGWLPEGWTVTDTDVDTAYDWVEMSVADADGADAAYAIFFADPEADTANYIVQEDGKMVEGREINVTDFGEGGLSVTVREGGVYGNVMFASGAIDVDTVGKIVAGITF